jgi:anti-sigma regulatory factor (Ser/Thr protein kinase)
MADLMTGTTGRNFLELPARPSSVCDARDHVAVVLVSLGLHDQELVDDAQLITSELVTNAVNAAQGVGGRVRVSAYRAGEWLVLEIWDDGAGVPRPMDPGDYDVSGRGLQLVEALSRRWGYHRPHIGGKVIWVELEIARA